MNNKEIHYVLTANIYNSDDWGSNEYESYDENELDKAISDFEKFKLKYPNVSLRKTTVIEEIIKEKETNHVCEFFEIGTAIFSTDKNGKYVQPELRCSLCDYEKYGEKIYLKM